MLRTFLLTGASALAMALALALAATSAEALTFVNTGSVQHYTVATTGIYDVVAAGARGSVGNASNFPGSGGAGIAIGAHVSLTAGSLLDIIVGGGGSFFLAGMASPVVIGGGAGAGGVSGYSGGGGIPDGV